MAGGHPLVEEGQIRVADTAPGDLHDDIPRTGLLAPGLLDHRLAGSAHDVPYLSEVGRAAYGRAAELEY